MAGLDFNNPAVAVAAVLAVLLVLDLSMAGGAMSSSAACGIGGAMGTHFGWLGMLLIAALVWLALGGPLPAGVAGTSVAGDVALLLVGAALAAFLGFVLVVLWLDRGRAAERRPASPAEVLRLRYCSGELSREQYRRMQLDVLKDRYVRGDLGLETYEVALGRLLEEPRADGPAAAGLPLQQEGRGRR